MAHGRKTGGRQKGSKNKATLAAEAAAEAAIAGLPRDVSSLILVQSVYNNPDLPFPLRMKAAEIAMPYEHHKLATIEHTGKDGGPIQTEDLSAMSSEERAQRLALLVAGLTVPTTH